MGAVDDIAPLLMLGVVVGENVALVPRAVPAGGDSGAAVAVVELIVVVAAALLYSWRSGAQLPAMNGENLSAQIFLPSAPDPGVRRKSILGINRKNFQLLSDFEELHSVSAMS